MAAGKNIDPISTPKEAGIDSPFSFSFIQVHQTGGVHSVPISQQNLSGKNNST
ncbi:hypothetical protein L2D08_20230 [Domibacillus sp. PGB-M46]|uniref:hypothetical protein n=1 Tax=Domibacillus sp. PGB-M46 TaxID=2910255 RepID=UPI001F55E374|nr:hypothetical protein [Domibacillus sp. PGB-M46]MCI2256664.1 hypothetical protein [Domibacillus sp. PGB-M46]